MYAKALFLAVFGIVYPCIAQERVRLDLSELVNRNTVTPGELPSSYNGEILFPAKYDWEEYGRVVVAIENVCDHPTEPLIEALIEQSDDKRFLVAMSSNGGRARGYSRGEVFELVVWRVLTRDIGTALESTDHVVLHNFYRDKVRASGGMKAWRKTLGKKKINELQIEIATHIGAALSSKDAATRSDISRLTQLVGRLKNSNVQSYECDFFDQFDIVTQERALAIKRKYFLAELQTPDFLIERVPLPLFDPRNIPKQE